MVRSCSVSGCKTRFTKGTKFHKFPKDSTLRKKWIEAIGRTDFIPSETAVICSIHFTKGDYTINPFGNKVLRKNVLPSMFDVTIKEELETIPNIETVNVKEETMATCNSNDEGTITAYNSNDEGTISAYNSNDEGTLSSCEFGEVTFEGKPTLVIYEDGINLDKNNMKGAEKIEIVNMTGEKQAIIEIEKIFNERTHSDMASIKSKRPYRQYRYIGDLKNVDFTSPDEARRCLEIALGCVDNQKLKIKRLRQQVKNANRFVLQSEFEMQRILEKKVMEEEDV